MKKQSQLSTIGSTTYLEPDTPATNMMRVAIAGTNNLAANIAHFIREETSHQLVMLSRFAQPNLQAQGFQIMSVDYNDVNTLQHALMGVDIVISTVTGQPQLNLIQAAISRTVRRFIPAEFEGPPSVRPAQNPLDQGRAIALSYLEYYRSQGLIEYTALVCGIFYERFSPGGLAQHRLGLNTHLSHEGDYIANLRTMESYAPVYDHAGQPTITICMTGMRDVARWVVKVIDMQHWPTEMTMYGERITVWHLLGLMTQARGRSFGEMLNHSPVTLASELQLARSMHDVPLEMRVHQHLATVAQSYNYDQPFLNPRFPDVVPESFRTWIQRTWGGIP